MKADVLILAGGKKSGEFKDYTFVNHKPLIKIKDRPMVDYVIEAVKKARFTNRIMLVGHQSILEKSPEAAGIDFIASADNSMIDNLKKGIHKLKNNYYILVITSDIPLIKGEIIDKFIEKCFEEKADIYYPVIPKSYNQEKFPGMKRTYVKFKEETYTGGNMVLFNPEIWNGILDWFEKAIRWRKKPWKLSRLLGFKFIFKFLLNRLTLKEIEERVSEITGCQSRAVIMEDPEIGFDIDKPSDLKLMREKYLV